MMKIIHDVNAYVEENSRYQTDAVAVNLDEGSLTVTVYPVDVYENLIEGASAIVQKTLPSLEEALEYYEDIVNQLEQLDIIRNI